MLRFFGSVCLPLAIVPMAFLVEPRFPLGDWRWGAIALLIFLIPAVVLYRDSVRSRIVGAWRLVRTIRIAQQYESGAQTAPHDTLPRAAPVPAPPPDEQLVILCRRYALPAYEALSEVVSDVTVQCFARGCWRGLAARLMKDQVVTPNVEKVENVKAGLDGSRSAPLEEDFEELFWAYEALMGLAYQFGRHDIDLDQPKLERWGERDHLFEERLSDLAAGVNREDLAILADFPSEARYLLHGLREPSRP